MRASSSHRRNIKRGTRIHVAVGIITTTASGNIVQRVNRLQHVLAQAEDNKSDTHQAHAVCVPWRYERFFFLSSRSPCSRPATS